MEVSGSWEKRDDGGLVVSLSLVLLVAYVSRVRNSLAVSPWGERRRRGVCWRAELDPAGMQKLIAQEARGSREQIREERWTMNSSLNAGRGCGARLTTQLYPTIYQRIKAHNQEVNNATTDSTKGITRDS